MLRLKESTKCACIGLVHVRSFTFENTSKAVRETEQNKESLVYRALMQSLFLSTYMSAYRKEREKQAIIGRGCVLTVCKGEDGVNAGVELCQSVQ